MLDRISAAADTDNAHRETLAWRVGTVNHASCVAKTRIAVERLPSHSDAKVKSVAKRLILRRSAGGTAPASIKRRISALNDYSSRLAKKGRCSW